MPSSSMIALGLSLFATYASSSPLTQRQTAAQLCRPNFEGVGLSVTNSAVEWGLPANSQAVAGTPVVSPPFTGQQVEFRFEFTGAPSNTFLIKPLANPELVVTSSPDGSLSLATPNTSDPLQSWNVKCKECSTASSSNGQFTFGCSITSASNNLCVQLGDRSNGATTAMVLRQCNGSDAQNFDFGSQVKN